MLIKVYESYSDDVLTKQLLEVLKVLRMNHHNIDFNIGECAVLAYALKKYIRGMASDCIISGSCIKGYEEYGLSHVFIKFNGKYIDGSGIINNFDNDEIVIDNLKDYGDSYGSDKYGVINHHHGGIFLDELYKITELLYPQDE